MALTENIYDGDTLPPQFKQVERLTWKMPRRGIVDSGYRGRKTVEGVKILFPARLFASVSRYLLQKNKKPILGKGGNITSYWTSEAGSQDVAQLSTG
ncbi:MAG: hypothetical protein RBT74_02160 [Tenuifilaceae bacterium]|jgi:hypothetical protein|nr:hypothetical protein [Tenuifilaceae bacterium]